MSVAKSSRPVLLSELEPDASHRRLARTVGLASALVFCMLVPFAQTPLGAYPAFIAAYQAALATIDVITATLIFSQYAVAPSAALAALGGGYVFTGVMAILHALTFPGLIAPAGILGGGAQTTAWMYIVWHAIFPLFLIAYAALKGRKARSGFGPAQAVLLAGVIAAGGTLFVTAGHELLPRVMRGNNYTEAAVVALGATWLLSALAALVLWRRRPYSVLDLWLIVTMVAWICDVGLSAVFNAGRYDLGFYAGRLYGLLALSLLLVVFLSEYGILYFRSTQLDAASASEARFRTMADAMPQLAWMARPDGWIYWYNRRWYEYTGTTPADMEGWGWQSVHEPSVLPDVLERWRRSVATGESFEMVFPLRGADGVFRPFLTRVSPFKDEAGKVVHWFGTNTDITAQRAAEEALRRADRRKDEFIATLAHELRNPLAPIRTAVEIMRRGARELAEPLALARDIIDRQSRHLARLLDDLLELSRMTRGKIEPRKARVALQPAIEHALEAVRPLAEGQRLLAELPREAVHVDADETHLTQVFLNLLSNAVKFTPPGGSITLALERQGGEAVVRVRDTGIGIPREHLPRLFETFSQVTPALERSQGGLGIGLALVRGLLELHGGSVRARSEGPGRGSEFEVRLPLAAAPARADEPAPAAAGAAAPRRRVLVADDNRDAALTLRRLLESLGHEVMEAHDGMEAVAAARTFQPDVVLLDIGMPRMNGYDAAREIRQHINGRAVRIVAVTGWGQEDDKRRARDAGFDLHLTKPVDLQELENVLQR